MERPRGPGTIEQEFDHERRREEAALLVDQFSRIVEERHGVSLSEIIDMVKLMRENKAQLERLKHAGMVSLLSVVIGASLLALWEGLRAFLRGDGR